LKEEHEMTAVLESVGLGKRYGQRWALSDCTVQVPAGRVTAQGGQAFSAVPFAARSAW